MVSDEMMALIRELIADGLLECICTVCDKGVHDENVISLRFHKAETGHAAVLARQGGAVVRRLTPKGRKEADAVTNRLLAESHRLALKAIERAESGE
jgi:transcription antitermination factor NusA-like protein